MNLHLCRLNYLQFCPLMIPFHVQVNVQNVTHFVNKGTKSVIEWLKVNKTSPKLNKTHSIVFSHTKKILKKFHKNL